MTAMVVQCAKEPVLVVAEQADHLGADLVVESEDGVYATLAVVTPVDVVAQEDHGVIAGDLARHLFEQVV